MLALPKTDSKIGLQIRSEVELAQVHRVLVALTASDLLLYLLSHVLKTFLLITLICWRLLVLIFRLCGLRSR